MSVRPTIDMRGAVRHYGDAIGFMAKLTKLSPKHVTRSEAGIVLKSGAARTKVASAAKLTAAGRLRGVRGMGLTRGAARNGVLLTVNAGKRAPYGRTWAKAAGSQKWQLVFGEGFARIPRKFAADVFAAARDEVREVRTKVGVAVKKARASGGIARQSWVLIADALRIALEGVAGGSPIAPSAIAKARQATAGGGKNRRNGAAQEQDRGAKGYGVTLINRLPYGRRIGLDRMLAFIMAGRAKFFAAAVKKGFDGSLKQTGRLFPGWFTR